MNIPENTYLTSTTEYHYNFPPKYSAKISLTYYYNQNKYGYGCTIFEGLKEVDALFHIGKFDNQEKALEDSFIALLKWAEKRSVNE